MKSFFESPIGHTFARAGILSIILAWALWVNDKNTERLFVIVANNTAAMLQVKQACVEMVVRSNE